MGRLVGWCVGGGGRQKVEETRVGVTRHREHVVVALAVEDGSHVHAESTSPGPSALGVGSTATSEKRQRC